MRWAGGDPTVELWEPEQRLRAQGSLNGDVLGPRNFGLAVAAIPSWKRLLWRQERMKSEHS